MSSRWVTSSLTSLVTPLVVIASLLAIPRVAFAHIEHVEGFSTTTAVSGLTNPTNLEFAPDGSVFVTEKGGRVVKYDGLADPTFTVVADLSGNVHDYWDRGMLGLAVDPGYPDRPFIYVSYAYDPGNSWGDTCPSPPGGTEDGCVIDGRISQIRVGPDGRMVGGEQVLTQGRFCQQYPSHSMGDLEFGPDGWLYASAGEGASFSFEDYGQRGSPPNPCGDGPVGAGSSVFLPDAEGGALRSQDVLTPGDPLGFSGAVIRIDPDTGLAAPGNPFAGGNPQDDPIIAYGLRNPFRLTFRPGTSELWIADVNHGDPEELNVIADPGDPVVENFGWPCYSGNERHHEFDILDLTLCEDLYSGSAGVTVTGPRLAYPRAQPPSAAGCVFNGASVTGLAFYDNGPWPDEFDGALFIADYTFECVWMLLAGSGGEPDMATARTVISGRGVVDLEMGPDGNLYAVDLDAGAILRLQQAGDPPIPTDDFHVSDVAWISETNGRGPVERDRSNGELSAGDGGTISIGGTTFAKGLGTHATSEVEVLLDEACTRFEATIGVDDEVGPLGTVVFEIWGDDALRYRSPLMTGSGSGIPIAIDVAGVSRLRLVAGGGGDGVDKDHASWGDALIRCDGGGPNQAPTAAINAPGTALRWRTGDVIVFSGTGTDPEDGALSGTALRWEVISEHCTTETACHEHLIEQQTGFGGSFVAPSHSYPAFLNIRLTAMDSQGKSASSEVRLAPATKVISLLSDPPGISLSLAGASGVAPRQVTGIVGSTYTLSAPAAVLVGPVSYTFAGWSDGLGRSHEITIGEGALTLLATYAPGPPLGPAGVGLFDQANGHWMLRNGDGQTREFYFGRPGDLPLLGDWNCDGTDTVGVYRSSQGSVSLRNSNTLGIADVEFYYGQPGDLAISGDWNGNGCDTVAVYRDGIVYIRNSLGTGPADIVFYFGQSDDIPFSGDFDGNGRTDVGVFRPANATVHLLIQFPGGPVGMPSATFSYGTLGDRIVAGDWNATGQDAVGVFRPASARFFLRTENSSGPATMSFRLGRGSWLPLAGQFET